MEYIKYCGLYKDISIHEIEFRVQKDNIPVKYSELLKTLCRGTLNSELIGNLVVLKKMAEYFIENGTMDLDIYKKRLEKIKSRIKEY